MAIYQIEGPNGGIFEIEGPENATDEQLQKAAYDYYMSEKQQQTAAVAPQPPAPPDLYSGQTLQFGPFDTGIELSPEVSQGLIGAGARLTDVPLALRSIKERVKDTFGYGEDARSAAINAEIEQKQQTDKPVYETTGGKIGQVAGDIAIGLPFGGAGLVGAAAAGGAMELTKPLTAEESYLAAAGKGAATGAVVQGALSGLFKIGKSVSNRFSEKAVADAAKQYQTLVNNGIEPDLSQIFDSRFLDSTKSRLHALPFTATKQAKISVNQMKQFNRRVLQTAGINADTATPEVIDKAYNVLGNKFNDLIATTPKIKIDQKALNNLSQIAQDVSNQVTSDKAALVLRQIDDIQNKIGAGDIITGESYKALRTTLNGMRASWRKNPNMSDASPFMGRLVAVLDDAVGDSVGAAKKEAWKNARSQYAALSTIADSNAIDEFGMISANKLYTAVRNGKFSSKKDFARGKLGELATVARMGKQIQSKIPDSGTAGNIEMQNLLTGKMISPITQETDTMIRSVLRAGEGWVFSKTAQGLFNSSTLRNILLNRTPVQRGVIGTMKAIEREVKRPIPVSVRQGLARTIRSIQQSQLTQKAPGLVGTAAALDYQRQQPQ